MTDRPLNRRERRAAAKRLRAQVRSITSAANASEHIPVFGSDDLIVAMIPKRELVRYEHVPNATVLSDPETGAKRVVLRQLSDDSTMAIHRGNPLVYSYDHETDANPKNVWAMRHLVPRQPEDRAYVRDIFRLSVLDCIDPIWRRLADAENAIDAVRIEIVRLVRRGKNPARLQERLDGLVRHRDQITAEIRRKMERFYRSGRREAGGQLIAMPAATPIRKAA